VKEQMQSGTVQNWLWLMPGVRIDGGMTLRGMLWRLLWERFRTARQEDHSGTSGMSDNLLCERL